MSKSLREVVAMANERGRGLEVIEPEKKGRGRRPQLFKSNSGKTYWIRTGNKNSIPISWADAEKMNKPDHVVLIAVRGNSDEKFMLFEVPGPAVFEAMKEYDLPGGALRWVTFRFTNGDGCVFREKWMKYCLTLDSDQVNERILEAIRMIAEAKNVAVDQVTIKFGGLVIRAA